MVTKIQKRGNSQGVRFPQGFTPSLRIRGRYRLADIVARIPEDYEPCEESWGPAVGREAE